MIEFKSECGHTVRARDEDAGGVVRCSYCGRMANVPETTGDDLDFLFRDMEADAGSDGPAALGAPPKKSSRRAKRVRKPTEFNPFAVVMKLCYAALLIIVVIFVGRKFVAPLFQDGGIGHVIRDPASKTPKPVDKSSSAAVPGKKSLPFGLIDRGKLGGLYISSVPVGGRAVYVKASKAPASGRINKIREAKTTIADGRSLKLVDGAYVVEVSFKWNSRKLTGFKGFKQFRKSIQDAPEQRRRDRADKYFMPDRADAIFVEEVAGNYFLVRQYRNVEVRSGRSKGVRSMFLPRILSEDGGSFDIKTLLADGSVPSGNRYSFDEGHVRNELDFHGVRSSDQPSVMEALRRIGAISWLMPDGVMRQFEIDMYDGSVDSPRIMQTDR